MNPGRTISFSLLAGIAIVMMTASSAVAQTPDSIVKKVPPPELGPFDTIPVPAAVYQMELIPAGTLQWLWITAPYPKHLLKKRQEWTRLRNAIYVTYPYARKAGVIMNEMNNKLANMQNKDERKKYIKSREQELKKQFADPLQELSIYQGRVLMKLINRQTGNNCYDIIKEYKGGFSARFWQTVAFLFNSNLKQPYNAGGSEYEMEQIVLEVERMYRM